MLLKSGDIGEAHLWSAVLSTVFPSRSINRVLSTAACTWLLICSVPIQADPISPGCEFSLTPCANARPPAKRRVVSSGQRLNQLQP
ncbi:hypothetical protein [Synechococcus sp. UW179A]|uniref:hypothetical protein n=1 Tax=Synechococcus sp. UW179A TaxID=2575510 RepID=UPI000E0FD4E2|nr:hypothetical protein [Synechococcus sp. UW179A]